MIPGVSQFGKGVNQLGKVAGAVGGYVSNIAREARDIPTAIGTNIAIGRSGQASAMQGGKLDVAGTKNFVNQVKEVGGAVLGSRGTPSAQYSQKTGYVSFPKSDSRNLAPKLNADPVGAFGPKPTPVAKSTTVSKSKTIS